MKRITITACFAFILLSCNNAGENSNSKDSTNTDSSGKSKSQTTSMPDSATMMNNWMAYMTPGELHKMMASWDGAWTGEVKMWMDPGAPPEQSTLASVNKTIMGGRFQENEHKGMMMGQPFEGKGTLAYDNIKKKFISTWIDNMGTGVMALEGTWDDASKTMNLKGKAIDPMRQQETDVRESFKIIDDNTHLMEMFGPGPDGREMKMMEIKFTRKK